jgi:hypothetical protein
LFLNGLRPPRIARKPAGCVIEIEALSDPMRVRNLTVSRAHVFYANGFLTHNCDALGLIGQLLDQMIDGPTKDKPEVKQRDDYREKEHEFDANLDALTL